jgi:hypothetical protein
MVHPTLASRGNEVVKGKGFGGQLTRAKSHPWTEDPPLAKAKQRSVAALQHGHLARAELLDKPTRVRLEDEVESALKRRTPNEARLAGALRAVAPLSPALRTSLGEATAVLIQRGARHRPLYACGLRALAEAQDRQAVPLLQRALSDEEAGGSAALSAACFCHDSELQMPLARIAASRQSHLAFGAELARVARGESNGALLAQLAPMIKESHRIAMCVELFVPLVRGRALAKQAAPALSILREAERHLGRWLVLAELAVKAGDSDPVQEAAKRAQAGPASSRSAWALVLWALRETQAIAQGSAPPAPPGLRPTLEVVARLSDRPSADRDTTFLFRMARAGSMAARPMLEAFARARPLADEAGLRAAFYLAHDDTRQDLPDALVEAATECKREELRGMAAAALWDVGSRGLAERGSSDMRARACEAADELMESKVVGNLAWGALVRAASKGGRGHEPVLTETPLRWIQWGWVE